LHVRSGSELCPKVSNTIHNFLDQINEHKHLYSECRWYALCVKHTRVQLNQCDCHQQMNFHTSKWISFLLLGLSIAHWRHPGTVTIPQYRINKTKQHTLCK